MPYIDDTGRRITSKPKVKPKTQKFSSKSGSTAEKTYAKPKAMAGLPKWAQEIRNNSDFMPVRVKPASYTAIAKAYASAQQPYQASVYAAPLQPTNTVTTLGNTYFRPTEEVTKGVVQQHNLWQDIKNMGGTVFHKGGGLLMGALDVLSRPLYGLNNVYNDKLIRHYTAPESSGGADVTGFEAFKGFLGVATPFGPLKDLVSGDFDDVFKAGWSGVSGKSKTTAFENLETVVPEFVEEHPIGSAVAAIGLNLVFDPLTWVTMGINPGSVARAGGSGLRLAVGDTKAASRLWNETLFTAQGRAAGAQTVKSHIKNTDIRKLENKQRKAAGKLEKSFSGKKTRKPEDQLLDKFVTVSRALSAKHAEDLQGSQLAWKIFKKSLPTAGIMTASRYNTGAGASTALSGANQIKLLSNDFHTGVSEELATEDRWQAAFAANQGRDFVYNHGGESYTVNLSEAKNTQEFVKIISEEASPLASYAEHGTVAARSRKGHIIGAEARGLSFRGQFKTHVEDIMLKALGPDVEKHFDSQRTVSRRLTNGRLATDKELQTSGIIHFKESDLLDPKNTYEDIKALAKKEWENANKGTFQENRAVVHYTGVDGKVRRVHLVTLKNAGLNEKSYRASRLKNQTHLNGRSDTVKAVDKLTGVSDEVAVLRARYIEAANRVRVFRESDEIEAAEKVLDAENDLKNAETAFQGQVFKVINNSNDFTAEEKAKYGKILFDESMPLEERLATILRDRTISNDEANDLLEDLFKIYIDDKGTIHVSKGGSLEDIPTIVKAVIRERFESRVSAATLKASGAELQTDELGNFKVVMNDTKGNVAFRRDLNAELGMMILDGYRVAAKYAAQNDLYQDPEALFDVIHKTASEFIDLAAAESKRQVIQLMFNATGLRLPEKFTPSFEDMTRLISNKEHIFMQGENPVKDQQGVWEKLGRSMQNWALEPLQNIIPTPKNVGVVEQGKDMAAAKAALEAKAAEVDTPFKNPSEYFERRKAKVDEVVDDIENLKDLVNAALVTSNGRTVGRYTLLDFVLHAEYILKAQSTTVRVARLSGGKLMGRLNAGRLSALDSFTFLDEEAQAGLKAIKRLKGMTSSSDPEIAELAKRELAVLYVDSGGLDHLDELTLPITGSLGDIDFRASFDTLGIHARLKESSLRTGSPFQTGHAAQLLDAMWKDVTVNHELMKSFQNAILNGVWVKGQKEEIVAKDLAKNIDDFFKPYDRLKKLIYPVREDALPTKSMIEGGAIPGQRTTREMSPSGIRAVNRNVQKSFGNNPITSHRNAPMINVEDKSKLSFSDADGNPIDKSEMKVKNVSANTIKSTDPEPVLKYLKDYGLTNAGIKRLSEGIDKIGEIHVRELEVQGEVKGLIVRVDGIDGNTPVHRDFYYSLEGGKPVTLTPLSTKKPRELKDVIKDALLPGDTIKDRHLPVYGAKEYAPKQMLNKELEYIERAPKKGLGIKAEDVDSLIVARNNVDDAKKALAQAVERVKNGPKDDPAALAELAKAHAAYTKAENEAKAAAAGSSPDPVKPPTAGTPTAGATPDPNDIPNSTDYQYTDDEIDVIRNFIGVTNAANRPALVANQLHAYSMAMAEDIQFAQSKMISDMSDYNIEYGGRLKFMGVPLMPVASPMNATHTAAGVVAFEQELGNVRKFFAQTVMGKVKAGDKSAEVYMKMSRPSQYLEGTLERIRVSVVNFASEARKAVVRDLEGFYQRALYSEYNVPEFNAMSRKKKFAYIRKQMFLPSQKGVPDAIEQFNLADGTNPVNDIVANMHENAAKIFNPNDPDSWVEQLEVFNRYMLDRYRLNKNQLNAIKLIMGEPNSPLTDVMPYSREWFQKIGQLLPASPFTTEKLLKVNLGELHYALQDTKLKVHSGRDLNSGVFAQFAFHVSPEDLKMHNEKVVPGTVDVNGKQLRGKWVSLDEVGQGTVWDIREEHIPTKFRGGNYYISEDILPDIKTVFEYMEEVSKINETINVGFIAKVIQYFKASVTVYKVPTYPVRNLISDVFMSAFDGLTNPGYYKDSIRLIMDYHKAMKQIHIEDFEGIFDGSFLKKESLKAAHDPASTLTPATAPTTPFSRTYHTAKGPVTMNGSQIMESFNLMGLGQNRTAGDAIEIMHGARQTKYGAGLGRVHDALRNVNDVREDFARLAHYLYALEREAPLGGDFEEIMRRAGQRVVKNHFDYNDTSLWERQTLGKWIPFYKWIRNIIPYTISTVITKPITLKAENVMNSVIGFLVDDDLDDNRKDFVIPEWIEYDNAVPIGSFVDANNNQFGQYMSLSMPLSDTLKRTIGPMIDPLFEPANQNPRSKVVGAGEGVAQVLGSAGNPIAKAIVQAATEQEMWWSGPKAQGADSDWLSTLNTVVPGQPMWEQFKGATDAVKDIRDYNLRSFIMEQLGVINVHFNKENYQLGELNQREDYYRPQLNAAKAEIMNNVQKKFPNSTPEQRKQLVELILKETRKEPDNGRISLRGT